MKVPKGFLMPQIRQVILKDACQYRCVTLESFLANISRTLS